MASGRQLTRLLLALALVVGWVAAAQAADCEPGWPKGVPCAQPAYKTVWLEHRDRIHRLKRLAKGREGFEFSTTVISRAEHGLTNFPTDIPVLRVRANVDVFFNSGSDVIRPEAYPVLDIIAESLKREPPDVSLFVAGHTDSRGSAAYNYHLGLKRAQAVAEALVRRGVYQANVYRISFGEAVPVASNATAEGRARNRRVEFLFAAKTKAIVLDLKRQKVKLCEQSQRDKSGYCRTPITFNAQKVSVPLRDQRRVAALARQAHQIRMDRNLSKTEVMKKLEKVEIERHRIAVVISPERIPVEITPEPKTALQ